MVEQTAIRKSWKTTLMPKERARLRLEKAFMVRQFNSLRKGLVPQEMEDKWFIFYEKGWLYFHRSWRPGLCIYQVKLTEVTGRYKVTEAWVNRDKRQYKNTDDEHDVRLLSYLIDRLLLGKKVDFPLLPGATPIFSAAYRWSMVGYARSRAEEPRRILFEEGDTQK
jgi:hypothetical protein